MQLNGTAIGPVEEGDDMTLVCRVVGGKCWVMRENVRTLIAVSVHRVPIPNEWREN